MNKKTWNDDQLKLAVLNNKSISGVMRQLGLKPNSGGSATRIKVRIKELELDISHFTGMGWCIGEHHKKLMQFVEIPLEEILVVNSTYQNTHKLKLRLIKANLLENKCYECGLLPFWNGKKLGLEIDHIDGERTNNSIDNLRILCPNCHAQTSTYCSKNKKNKAEKIEPVNKPEYVLKIHYCSACNCAVDRRSDKCESCYKKSKLTKINWPPTSDLLQMVLESSYLAVAEKLGVSDNAIRKRVKNHSYEMVPI